MRHRKSGVKLNRTTSHRQAMFRNMVTSLLKHDKIKTTAPKAKELRRWADHVITLAKRGDLHARRQAMSIVREKDVVHKLFEEAAERFGTRNGGYTRIVKIGRRPGDAAPLSIIELLGPEDGTPAKPQKASPTPAEKAASAEISQKKDEALVGDTADEADAAAVEESVGSEEVTEAKGEPEAGTENTVQESEAVDTTQESSEPPVETSEKPKKTDE